jgi:penicillin-binding protein 1A
VGFRWILFPYEGFRSCPIADRVSELERPGIAVDRRGEFLGTLDQRRGRYVPLDSLAPEVPLLFVSEEDRRFFERRSAIDTWSVLRAAYRNLAAGAREGASTIEMQVVRILCDDLMPPDGTWLGKLSETGAAWHVRRHYQSREILEWYLNGVYLGRNREGIEAAAEAHFGVRAEELSLAEAAQLAALVKSPASLDPRVLPPAAARRERLRVLTTAARAFPEHAGTFEGALQDGIRVLPAERGNAWFIEAAARHGPSVGSHDTLFTTLDPDLQRAAERELSAMMSAIERGAYGSYRGGSRRLLAVFAALNARTGEVLAYVPGPPDREILVDWVDRARIRISSTLKPILYGLAIEYAGLRSSETLAELERRAGFVGLEDPWILALRSKSDLSQTAEEALARSSNYLAVCLLELLPPEALRQLYAFDVLADVPSRPAEALGTHTAAPLDLLRFYAAIANGGTLVERRFVRAAGDQTLFIADAERIWSLSTARLVERALEGVVDRGTGRAVRRILGDRYRVAGKTGTAEDNGEFVFVGMSGDVVALLWVGHDMSQPIVARGDAGTIVAPAWARIMAAHRAKVGDRVRMVTRSVW